MTIVESSKETELLDFDDAQIHGLAFSNPWRLKSQCTSQLGDRFDLKIKTEPPWLH
jgi:hypothetical protein